MGAESSAWLPHWITSPGSSLSVEQTVACDPGLLNQPFLEKPVETRGMRGRRSDVLVQVKHLNLAPIDSWKTSERRQKLELRRPSGRNQPSAAVILDRSSQDGAACSAATFAISPLS